MESNAGIRHLLGFMFARRIFFNVDKERGHLWEAGRTVNSLNCTHVQSISYALEESVEFHNPYPSCQMQYRTIFY